MLLFSVTLYVVHTYKAFNRDAGTGGGGGAVGATCSHNLEAVGRHPFPPLFTVNVVHFYFCLFLFVNSGLSPKIVGQIWGVFSLGRGYLGHRETFAPPPPL